MKHTHENKRIFSTFLLSYLSFLLAMFTCCLIFAGKISRQLLQETVLLKQNLVSSMEQNVENDLENLLEYTNGLAFDQELILAIQHPDVYSGSDVSHILANRGRLPNYIHDAFLYLPDTDKVVTASISMDAERFFSIIYQIGDLPAFHSACLESYQFRAFCQPVALQQYGSKQTMELLPFVQSLPISAFQSPAAQLVVLIDPSVLFAQASAAYTDDTDIYILNASDELIYDSQDALALNWQDIDWSQPVLRTDQGILVSCSGESGWHYAARIPGDLFLRQNRSTIRFLAVVFAAYLAIGAGLALWLSKRNYRPVRALKELAVSGGAVSGSNEYELIRHALQQHMQAGQDLSHILEQQRPILLRDHLAALLRRQTMDIDTAQQLLDACIDALPQRQETATGRTKQLADRIAAYIDEHANDDWLDLSTLSQEFGVTPQYISNIFKKQRDENVKDYISQRKLARAKELLATTDLPVREIALRLGYTSEASIIRMFRKYEGITPGEYRLLHAGKQTEEP